MSQIQATGLTLRVGEPEDAETCGPICYEAFKVIAEEHNFPPDLTIRQRWRVDQ